MTQTIHKRQKTNCCVSEGRCYKNYCWARCSWFGCKNNTKMWCYTTAAGLSQNYGYVIHSMYIAKAF